MSRKYGIVPFGCADDFAWVDEWFEPWRTSWTFRGQFVDTDRYEIRPKESYKKELIEKKRGEAERLQKQIEELNKEIKELDGS